MVNLYLKKMFIIFFMRFSYRVFIICVMKFKLDRKLSLCSLSKCYKFII